MFKILNLYAGIGGNRKLWDQTLKEEFGDNYQITAIEINPEVAEIYQEFFPGDIVLIEDAHQYLLDHFQEYDFIWSSPPCPTHSAMARVNAKRYGLYKYIDIKLWQEIIFLKEYFEGLFIIENVKPYYDPFIYPDFKIDRHYFWTNFNITPFKKPNLKNFIDAKYEDLQKWLGIKMSKKIYLGGNHDYCQILRNCVHPETGLHILNCALKKQKDMNIIQTSLFDEKNNK